MANLAAWQRPDYVLKGLPWGDGKSGDATISSDPNVRMTVTGTDTELTSTVGANTLANGDLCFLHQTQGTGAGNYQWNMVSSGGGTTSIVWKKPLHYTFGSGAQCVKVPRYKIATVSAHSVTAWNGTTGGIEIILAKTSITVSSALSGVGGAGQVAPHPGDNWDGNNGRGAGGVGGGFRGGQGWGSQDNDERAYSGESYAGAQTQSTSANYGGGGGGYTNTAYAAGGGGGAHAAGGTNGTYSSGGGTIYPGYGGSAYGSADLTTIFPGSGGGGGAHVRVGDNGGGGAGGGVIILITQNLIANAAVNVTGGAAADVNGTNTASGGSGAGGSILVVCATATLGSNQLLAPAGWSEACGGAGSVGRIAVHHSGTVTGTTNPTFTNVTDATLKEKPKGGAFLFQFI